MYDVITSGTDVIILPRWLSLLYPTAISTGKPGQVARLLPIMHRRDLLCGNSIWNCIYSNI